MVSKILNKINETPYDLDELQNRTLPKRFLDRLNLLKQDVENVRALPITIENLLTRLNLTSSDIQDNNLDLAFSKLCQMLFRQIDIVPAPYFNHIDLKLTDTIIFAKRPNLELDSDIIWYNQMRGSTNNRSLIASRLNKAYEKINNYHIILRIFEALCLVTVDHQLNYSQRQLLDAMIHDWDLPSDCQRYFHACYTATLHYGVHNFDLSAKKVSPVLPEIQEKILLKILIQLAQLAEAIPSYKQPEYRYTTELEAIYKSKQEKVQSKGNHLNGTQYNQDFDDIDNLKLITSKTPSPYTHPLSVQDAFNGKYLDKEDAQLEWIAKNCIELFQEFFKVNGHPASLNVSQAMLQEYKTAVRAIVEKCKFYDLDSLKFHGCNDRIYIGENVIESPNIYSCTANEYMYVKWPFAVNVQPLSYTNYDNYNNFFSALQDSEMLNFIKVMQGNDKTTIARHTGIIISANLAYRIFVEGFLEYISPQERQIAFIWLVQWFKTIYNCSSSGALTPTKHIIEIFVELITMYAELYPEDLNDEHKRMLTTYPVFEQYNSLKLAQLCNNLLKENRFTSDKTWTTFSAEDEQLIDALYNSLGVRLLKDSILARKDIPNADLLILHKYCKNQFKLFLRNNLNHNLSVATNLSLDIIYLYTYRQKYFSFSLYQYDVLKQYMLSIIFNLLPSYQLDRNFPQAPEFKDFPSFESIIMNKGISPSANRVLMHDNLTLHKFFKANNDVINNVIYYIDTYMSYSFMNQLFMQIIDYDATREDMPQKLRSLKQQLLKQSMWSHDELHQLLQIQINDRLKSTHLINICCEQLGLFILPNPKVEFSKLPPSCYDNIYLVENSQWEQIFATNNSDSLNLTSLATMQNDLFLYHCALETAVHYPSTVAIHKAFLQHNSHLTPEQAKYVEIITQLRAARSSTIRFTKNLHHYAFSAEDLTILKSYFQRILQASDDDTTRKIMTKFTVAVAESNLTKMVKSIQTVNYTSVHNQPIFGDKPATKLELDRTVIQNTSTNTKSVHDILNPIFEEESKARNATIHAPFAGEITKRVSNEFTTPKIPETPSVEEEAPADLSDILHQDGNVSGEAIFKLLPPNCQTILKRLMQLKEFSQADFQKMCAEVGLMSDGAMEIINNWAYAQFDCSILEYDEPMFFDRELLANIIMQ